MTLILLIAALVVFILAMFPIPAKINLIPLGLALWVLSIILQHGI
jgi:hypothetical protein